MSQWIVWDRAAWCAAGAIAAAWLLIAIAAASPRADADPQVQAYADLVAELVRRIDAAQGGDATDCEEHAAEWADRALRAEAAMEDLYAGIEREQAAANAWAMRAGEAEASLRSARRGDLDGDGIADEADLGIVLLAISGELPEPLPRPWWWDQLPGGSVSE